jgi:hypothetical protein
LSLRLTLALAINSYFYFRDISHYIDGARLQSTLKAGTQLTLGEISLTQISPNNASEQQHIIFDPIPRVDGIEASADPLFEPRANIYLMAGRRRRAAGKQ